MPPHTADPRSSVTSSAARRGAETHHARKWTRVLRPPPPRRCHAPARASIARGAKTRRGERGAPEFYQCAARLEGRRPPPTERHAREAHARPLGLRARRRGASPPVLACVTAPACPPRTERGATTRAALWLARTHALSLYQTSSSHFARFPCPIAALARSCVALARAREHTQCGQVVRSILTHARRVISSA